MTGYIYFRTTEFYDDHNACKMGKTTNIYERDIIYAADELRRGCFEAVFEVPNENLIDIEQLIQRKFKNLNIRGDAGTEFYDKKIMNLVESYLQEINFNYKKLNDKEINNLLQKWI